MRADEETLIPQPFGPLQGIRILSTGTLMAQPYAVTLAAEMGAEVIQIERAVVGDAAWRTLEFPMPCDDGTRVAAAWVQTRRNSFHVTLDLSTPEGKELFLGLVAKADIWMESSIPGTYEEWGLDDATVLAANPKIVIAHVSGYGQFGHPDYMGRASYDFIGQAFGGLMNLTGFPDPEPPVKATPWTGDFITGLFCIWSSLAGYISAQRTGQGQVIDLAQYEAIHHTLAGTMVAYYEQGLVRERSGNKAGMFQPYDAFQASDGWVVIGAVGTVYDRVCRVLGLNPNEEKWRSAYGNVESPEGIEFDAILRGWVGERPVKEVVAPMNAAEVACSPIMTAKDMAEDPHYQARNIHIEWEDLCLNRKVKGTGIIPKFSATPGGVWRGSVSLGYDNDLVYKRLLSLSDARLLELQSQGVI